ncbi:hypothetical protein [Arthrobacter mobilis]|uniref:Uncharacterized protein n=1 Tax=Arthrobacter mobilis TaxID=2724944 RepID=A0A7X6HDV8_9MICC|nr:hypothetical protein [Arthrobacter mobilis]NKX55324.1 hypothetical protein [Arthrobacter mobilis]
MESAPIAQWWDRLEPGIREWFMDNPGTVVLPRTVVNAINAAVGDGDGPGQFEVSEADRQFVREQAEARRNGDAGS